MGPHARQGGLFPVFSRTSLLRRRGWRLVIVFLFGTRQAGGRGRAARAEKKRRETFLRVSSGPGDMRLGVSTGRGFDVFPCCGCKVREGRHPGRCGCSAGAEDGPEKFLRPPCGISAAGSFARQGKGLSDASGRRPVRPGGMRHQGESRKKPGRRTVRAFAVQHEAAGESGRLLFGKFEGLAAFTLHFDGDLPQ